MSYKNIAFILPLLATSSNGEQAEVWNAPQPSAASVTKTPIGLQNLVCPLQLECGEGMSASVSIVQRVSVTRITVIVGASKDTAIVASGTADSATLTIECDGQDVDLTVGTSANSWSEVASCNQVGLE